MDAAEMTKSLKYLEAIFNAKENDDIKGKAGQTWISFFKGLKSHLRDKQATPQDISFVESLYGEMSQLYDAARNNNQIASVKIAKKGTQVQVYVQKYLKNA